MPDATPQSAPVSDPNADLLQSSIASGNANIQTPGGSTYSALKATSPVATTSNPAATYVDNLGNTINNGAVQQPTIPSPQNPTGNPSAQPPASYVQFNGTYGPNIDPYGFGTLGYNAGSDPRVAQSANDANSTYATREQQLQTDTGNQISALQGQSAGEQQNLAQTQNADTAKTNRNLTYLQGNSTSASAQSYLTSLATSHQQEMNTIVAKYNSAIQTAQSAYNDKDFALAEAMTKNANDLKTEATTRNQAFLDYSLKLQTEANTQAKNQYDMQAATRTANGTNLKFARDNGLHPNAQFFSSGGQVYNSADGSSAGSTKEELLAAGVSPDLSNVQMIEQTKARPGVLGELDDFNSGLKAEGKPPINIEQWLQMKKQDQVAIAKAGRAVSNISVSQQKYDLTQEQTQSLAAVIKGWTDNKYIQGNGSISSSDYKKAKSAFVSQYGASAGPAFDDAMAVYVDSSDTNHYQSSYGLNKQVSGNSLAQ